MKHCLYAAAFAAMLGANAIAQETDQAENRPERAERGGERAERKEESRDSRRSAAQTNFGAKLRELVAGGKLTREEAGELFRLAFPDGGRGERLREPVAKRGRRYEVKDPAEFSKTQGNTVFSGPQPGEKLPAITATGINGEFNGKEFDIVAHAKGKPLMLVFQDNSGVGLRGLVGMSRTLPAIREKSQTDLGMVVVFLGDDPAALIESTRGVKQHVQNGLVMAISKEGRDGPGNYGLNRNVGMTVLLAKDGVITHNFVFPQSMLTPDPHLLGGVAELIQLDRADLETMLNEAQAAQQRMRKAKQ